MTRRYRCMTNSLICDNGRTMR